MAETILGETKREGQKRHNLKGPKRGRKLVSLMVGSYLTHNLFNVANMQILRFNNNGRFKTNIICQRNLLIYNKG
jgi:hypothetical protein